MNPMNLIKIEQIFQRILTLINCTEKSDTG